MTFPARSDVEAHSGAVIEMQDLVTYQSLGVVRGLTLRYDSLTADPRPILHCQYTEVYNPNQLLIARLAIARGSFNTTVPGAANLYGMSGNEHFWKVPPFSDTPGSGIVDGALLVDLRAETSGLYDYTFTSGVQYLPPPPPANPQFTPLTNPQRGSFVHINRRSSPFGHGWALVGWQELVTNPANYNNPADNNSVLLLDGDGNQWLFRAPSSGNLYQSPAGDFSRFERQSDGTFKRTLTDGTVYSFNAQGRLSTVQDRNGNVTQYVYNANGRLEQIVDPVNLTTSFSYTGDRVTTINHPGSRVTLLEYDANGNLTKLTHPDNAVFRWEYDTQSRIAASLDARNNRREFVYRLGRLERMTRVVDGNTQQIQIKPAAVQGLYPATETTNPRNAPRAFSPAVQGAIEAEYTDARNNLTKLQLNQRGDIVGSSDGEGTLGSTIYNAQNLITRRTNARGQHTDYAYDSRGNLTQITDSLSGANGRRFTYESTFNQLTSVIDELGRQTLYDIDPANGNVRSVTEPDPDGSGTQTAPVTQYTYTARGLVSTTTDPLGRVSSYTYNALGQLITATLAQGTPDQVVLSYTYDAAGNVATFTDARGHQTRFFYDAFNRLTRVEQPDPDGSGPQTGPITQFAYNPNGSLNRVEDARGNVTTYEYDVLNRLARTLQPDPDGGGPLGRPTTRYEYTANGLLRQVTDPLDRQTDYRYDLRDRLTEVINPLNQRTLYTYDPDNNLTGITDAETAAGTNTLTLEYDARNRLIKQTDAIGEDTTYEYDAVDNLTRVMDARNQPTRYEYDALNRQTAIIDPLNQRTSSSYDAVGNLVALTDALNQRTEYSYDALNRQTQIRDPRNGLTRFSYDPAGNLLSLIDPVNNTTSYSYDALSRLLTETNALSLSRHYEYDAVGNLVKLTDRNNQVRSFRYDPLNRMNREQWLGPTGDVVRTISASYDPANQLTEISDPAATYAYNYNAAGRVNRISNAGSPGPTVVLNATYNGVGQRLSLSENFNGQAQATLNFTYNSNQDLIRITQNGSGIAPKRIEFGYDPNRQLQSINRFASTGTTAPRVNTSLSYDNASRLTNLTHQLGTNPPLSAQSWQYDAANRITRFSSSPADGTSDYSYDPVAQLTAADHSYQTDEAYSYDLNGNRTTSGYQTGSNNRLLNDGTYSYAYDNEGNRSRRTHNTTGEITDYTWDRRNRLTRVEVRPSATGAVSRSVNYTYDAWDRRVSKSIDPDGAGPNPATVERYVYDRDHILLVFNGNNNLTHRYVYGPELDMALVDERSSNNVRWLLADNQGTIRDLTNNAGAVQNHIRYDSYGRITAQTDSTYGSRFEYTGRELDAETGLYYYRSRYYDPVVGRFLSEDRIGFEGEDANLYRYVGNSPVNFTDPWGQGSDIEDLLKLLEFLNAVKEVWDELNRTLNPQPKNNVPNSQNPNCCPNKNKPKDEKPCASEAGESRDFAHGTSRENAVNILRNGINENDARTNSRGGRNLPGSFHTLDISTESDALQKAYEFGLRQNRTPVVLVVRLPECIYDQLLREGKVVVQEIGESGVVETVFRPSSFGTLNRHATFPQVIDPHRR